ncbi:MAG: type II toxin-antitoxin system RelE/ParE family toxin [Polyangia bacterium]|jgi:plasmid stabilization system protein ParE|nr:type II toxin-antitoxin system RelE/ParE family toxin [Polyangia bacterium]
MMLVWLPEARQDIARLFDFLAESNPRAAEGAVRTIQRGAIQLLEHPELGRPMAIDGHRRELVMPFGAGAYIIRYRIEGEAVAIIRVWHGREERR